MHYPKLRSNVCYNNNNNYVYMCVCMYNYVYSKYIRISAMRTNTDDCRTTRGETCTIFPTRRLNLGAVTLRSSTRPTFLIVYSTIDLRNKCAPCIMYNAAYRCKCKKTVEYILWYDTVVLCFQQLHFVLLLHSHLFPHRKRVLITITCVFQSTCRWNLYLCPERSVLHRKPSPAAGRPRIYATRAWFGLNLFVSKTTAPVVFRVNWVRGSNVVKQTTNTCTQSGSARLKTVRRVPSTRLLTICIPIRNIQPRHWLRPIERNESVISRTINVYRMFYVFLTAALNHTRREAHVYTKLAKVLRANWIPVYVRWCGGPKLPTKKVTRLDDFSSSVRPSPFPKLSRVSHSRL